MLLLYCLQLALWRRENVLRSVAVHGRSAGLGQDAFVIVLSVEVSRAFHAANNTRLMKLPVAAIGDALTASASSG